ncbi:MAG: integrase core domain-containing protein [Acidobacteria bacterium]|nr:integrase core domain-containing protein [Acidobacteriota bacterium]
MRLEEWQFVYNRDRPHSSLKGKTPMERYCELIEQTPLNEEAFAAYDADTELVQERNYKVEMQLRKLKRC